MKTIVLHETWIGTQFPCALEYDDLTGLDDDEERQLDAWVLGLIREAEESHDIFDPVIHFEYGEESEFEVCDITGLRGNCVAIAAFTLV
jgi:hypothetical protein